MFGFSWTALGLGAWSLLNLYRAVESLLDPHIYRYDFIPTVLGHGVLVGVPWLVWWWRDPEPRLRRAGARALRAIRLEALRLGPAFDELAVDAERFWDATGAQALCQYRQANGDLQRLGLGRFASASRAQSLAVMRDRSLADVERALTVLEQLGMHMVERRIVQLAPSTVRAHVEQLQREAQRSLDAHDEVRELGDGTLPT